MALSHQNNGIKFAFAICSGHLKKLRAHTKRSRDMLKNVIEQMATDLIAEKCKIAK